MIAPLVFDDIHFDKKHIEGIRKQLVELRNDCIKQGAMPEAFVLSVSHALLKHLEDNTEEPKQDNGQ